jgi:VWFA-related protein
VVCAVATLLAQQPPFTPRLPPGSGQDAPPVFRSGVEAVQVDVYVTDENDRAVTGLTADDFEVFENDRPQVITTFGHVTLPVERREPLPLGAEPDVQTNTRTEGHVYLFLLGGMRVCSDAEPEAVALRTRHLVRQFIDQQFGDNDIAAVVTGRTFPGDRQDFTSNRRLILAAIDRFDGAGPHAWELNELMTMMMRIPGGRKSVLWFTNVGLPGRNPGQAVDPFDLIDHRGGILSQEAEQAHAAMAMATRGNIRFYLIDPCGLTSGMSAEHNMHFRALANMTGGFAQVGSNTFTAAFERVVRETSTYYVLGFNSSRQKREGRYVRLDVKVKRPGLRVRARTGYLEDIEYVRVRREPDPVLTPLEAALANPLYTAGVPMRVFAAPYRKSSRENTVALAVDLDPAQLTFSEKNGTYSAALEIRHLATDVNHKIYPEYRHRTTMTLDATNHARMREVGLRVVSQFDVPKGRYQVRVASASGERTGSVVYDVDVPDFADGPLALSGIALATLSKSDAVSLRPERNRRTTQRTRQCRTPTCEATVALESTLTAWSAGGKGGEANLLNDVLPAPPTTRRDFVPDETLALFAEVYDNNGRVRRDPPYTIDVAARLLDASGEIVRLVSDRRESRATRRPSGGHGFTLRLPLEDTAPGTYVLQVEARSGRDPSHRAARSIPIRVR